MHGNSVDDWPSCSADCCRLTHDITLDNISTVDDADTAALVYECNKQNDVYQQQQQRQATSSTLLDKLQSRIETRNQRNAAKSRLTTASDVQAEKADSERSQTETPADKKQQDDTRLAAICRSPRIEELADAGLNALSGCRASRRRQMTDSTVMCRNVELTPPTRITSRLHEIRQRFKSEVFLNQSPSLEL